ncbi:MAG: RNA polymerase sigma factor [Deltaproteobacteria bacterium]|nr:RNA polymerase sigma factor [Deltaproteobacteria bacterium]
MLNTFDLNVGAAESALDIARSFFAAPQKQTGQYSVTDSELNELIFNAQKGDKQSFEKLIDAYLPYLSREISKLCPADALHDVAQEVLIRVYRALPTYREEGSFRWWLRKIVSRACLDYWRSERHKERKESAYVLAFQDQTTTKSDQETRLDLQRFFGQLSVSDRVVFTLSFLENLPHKEIAELLDISLTATKVRCFRLKQKAKSWFTL